MEKSKFKFTYKNETFAALVHHSDHKTLGLWAVACVERVLPFFEAHDPQDSRPREAIHTLQRWIVTSVFKMAVIRKASLDAHAAAREVGEDNPARSAARAAGQAVATAHVPAHALGAANYALQAVHRASDANDADAAVVNERAWQYQHLLDLQKE